MRMGPHIAWYIFERDIDLFFPFFSNMKDIMHAHAHISITFLFYTITTWSKNVYGEIKIWNKKCTKLRKKLAYDARKKLLRGWNHVGLMLRPIVTPICHSETYLGVWMALHFLSDKGHDLLTLLMSCSHNVSSQLVPRLTLAPYKSEEGDHSSS